MGLNQIDGFEWSVTVTGELREHMERQFSSATQTSRDEEYSVSGLTGQVWKWTYYFDDSCGKGDTMVEAIVSTSNFAQKPCCLPSHAVDEKIQHGPCINSTETSEPVCFCASRICRPWEA